MSYVCLLSLAALLTCVHAYEDMLVARQVLEPEVVASEGGTATLRCLFHGNPTPDKITWRFQAHTIDGNTDRYRLISDGALEINPLYRSDTGVYTCVADNGLGVATQEVHLVVNDQAQEQDCSQFREEFEQALECQYGIHVSTQGGCEGWKCKEDPCVSANCSSSEHCEVIELSSTSSQGDLYSTRCVANVLAAHQVVPQVLVTSEGSIATLRYLLPRNPPPKITRKFRQLGVHQQRTRHKRQNSGLYLPKSYVIPGGEGQGSWGEWGKVSPCSRTCGGGVASQKRICLQPGPEGAQCTGGNTKYFSCQTQDCPNGSGDFRAEQCAEFNDKAFQGFKYNWVPYTEAPNPCELNCKPYGERFYFRHKLQVTDGTRCNDKSFDVCVNGKCQPVGCDMMLNSSAREDKCRECRGNGANCRTTDGIFDSQDLMKGYNDILLIPAGSTSIYIEEVKPSYNYLALRAKNGTYFLNGHYHIDFPRTIMIAGALWTYERSQQGFAAPDKLRCLGPTNEPLYLSLLLQDENVGIRYEYSVPNNSAPPTDKQYNWVPQDLTPCSATCGGGFQTRNVTCRLRRELEIVDVRLCDEGLRPPTNQSCSPDPCPAQWVEGPWGECSQRCGSGGVKSRDVTCQKIIANGVKSVVPDKECFDLLGSKPEDFQKCNEDCPTWFVGNWKPCDKLCDEGKQTRLVICNQKKNFSIEVLNDDNCTEEKPEEEQPCMLQPCDAVDWVTSGWSGCDSCSSKFRTRTVVCATRSQLVNDSFCSHFHRPADHKECHKDVLPACEVQWYPTQWSKCSVNCGDGVQTRKVFCGKSYNDETGEGVQVVEDEKCANLTKYNNTKPCTVPKEECPSQWFAGPWSACSEECGGGEQHRRVMCFRGDKQATDCDRTTVLESVQFCNTGPCHRDPVRMPAGIAGNENATVIGELDSPLHVRCLAYGYPAPIVFWYRDYDEDMALYNDTEHEVSGNDLIFRSLSIDTLGQYSCRAYNGVGKATSWGLVVRAYKPEGLFSENKWLVPRDTTTTTTTTTTEAPRLLFTENLITGGVKEKSEETTELFETSVRSSTNEDIIDVIGTSTLDPCNVFEFGCCADHETEASGPDGQGCPCKATEFGCYPDGVSPGPVRMPAGIVGDENAAVIGELHSPLHARCLAYGYPAPFVFWYRDYEEHIALYNDTEHEVRGNDLMFKSLSLDTLGKYSCRAYNGVGKAASWGLVVRAYKPEGLFSDNKWLVPRDTTTTTTTTTTEAPRLLFTENSTTGVITETSEETTELFETSKRSSTQEDIIDVIENLITGGVTEKSEETTELFETSVRSSTNEDIIDVIGTSTLDPCNVFEFGCCADHETEASGLDGQGCPCKASEFGCYPDGVSPDPVRMPAGIAGDENATVIGELDSPLHVRCLAYGYPAPIVFWYRDYDEDMALYNDTEHEVSGNDLIFRSLSIDTLGQYSCRAYNGAGKAASWGLVVRAYKPEGLFSENKWLVPRDTTTTTITTTTEAPRLLFTDPVRMPAGIAGDENATVIGELDSPLHVRCLAYGYPAPIVFWYRDYEEDMALYNDTEHEVRGNDLMFRSLSIDTLGQYSCRSYNGVGKAASWGLVIRAYKPEGLFSDNKWLVPRDTTTTTTTTTEAPRLLFTAEIEGCAGPCSTSPHGCCQDDKTPAHGPDYEGCCLLQAYECCPDNRKPAEGPHLEGCGCQYALHGCCPDNVTIAQGTDNQGCGCQYTQHECCPDRHTAAAGPNNEGCACNTYQFGCCADGITTAKGPKRQGCHCRESKFACCGDRETYATGPDAAGCDCSSSRHGCCPDGHTEAPGPKFFGCTDAPENKQAACSMSTDPGPCYNFTAMWYFDLTYGGCSRFWYGGCNGNGNRFATKEECEDVCVQPSPKDACKLPSVKGACDAEYQRWHYNSTREQCIPFRYGGCLGNANNFDTRELCQKQCEPSSVADQCNLPIDQGSCAGNYSRWGFNSDALRCEQFIWGGCEGNSNRFSSEAACQMRCVGIQPPQCTQPQEAGNCTEKEALWSFSQSENRCLPFYYSGCGGNDNRFRSRESCEQTCPSAYVPDKCTLPAETGECSNYRTRWFYDTTFKTCRQFYYGGCGGNENNFGTEAECDNSCSEIKTTTTATITTTITTVRPVEPQPQPRPAEPEQRPAAPERSGSVASRVWRPVSLTPGGGASSRPALEEEVDISFTKILHNVVARRDR